MFSNITMNDTGMALRQPLHTIVTRSLSFNPCQLTGDEFTDFALSVIAAAVLTLPAVALWFVGKVITLISPERVNPDAFHLKPAPIELPADMVVPEYDLSLLADKFHELFEGTEHASKERTFRRFCEQCQRGNVRGGDQLFNETMQMYYRRIYYKMSDGSMTDDQQRLVFLELTDAMTCDPTWLQATHQAYLKVYNCERSPRDQLLQYVQHYKEGIILHDVQVVGDSSEWHPLDAQRYAIGEPMGLNTDTMDLDNYMMIGSIHIPFLSAILHQWKLLNTYENVAALKSTIAGCVNQEPYDEPLARFIRDFVLESPEYPNLTTEDAVAEYVAETCYDPDSYEFTNEGAGIALRAIGVIS